MHTNEPPSLLSGRHLRSFCFPPVYLRRIGGQEVEGTGELRTLNTQSSLLLSRFPLR